MNTTLTVKLNKTLRDEAKATAEELGLPLTTVLTALMRQFVREKKLSVSVSPAPTKAKIALWERISAEADKDKSVRAFTDVENLLKDLRLS